MHDVNDLVIASSVSLILDQINNTYVILIIAVLINRPVNLHWLPLWPSVGIV